MSHKHVGGRGQSKCVEIDPTVCLRPVVHGGSPDTTNPDGSMAGGEVEHLAGFHIAHEQPDNPTSDGYRCEGHVNVDPHFEPRPTWTMTGTLEGGDLTLSPSVLCSDGFHGFVQNGKWVPA